MRKLTTGHLTSTQIHIPIRIMQDVGVLIPNKKSDGGDEKNSVVTLHTIINIHMIVFFFYYYIIFFLSLLY